MTSADIIAFAATLEGQTLYTLTRKKAFTVRVVKKGLEYTPVFSKKKRIQEILYIDRQLNIYNETHSLSPKHYNNLTMNASYLIPIIKLYISQ